MTSANNSPAGRRDLVRQGYDHCAEAYHEARRGSAVLALTPLTARLPEGAAVLDVGCGAGVPLDRELSLRFSVTGVDISGEMIRLARTLVPEARFIHSDIMSVDLPAETFDAAIAFYSIFHLPRDEHGDLFRRLAGWLKPGGLVLATLSVAAAEPSLADDFFGVPMYWSHHSLGDYRPLLAEAGFDILSLTFVGHGYSPDYPGPDEHHPLILARKRPSLGELR